MDTLRLRPMIRRHVLRSSAAGLLLALLVVGPVLGHAELVTADPSDGAVLDVPPTTVTLTFSEGLDAGKSSFKLQGPSGTVGTGKAAADGGTAMTLTGLVLAPGAYTIEWTSAAQDGHIDRGTLGFTIATAAASATAAAPSASAAVPSAPPSGDASPSDAPSPSEVPSPTSPASGGDVVLPILAALVLVAIVAVVVFRRNRAA